MTDWNTDRLRAFEARVAAAFDRGEVAGPVHLSDGNEQQLIDYFASAYHPGDWVFGSWRSHYHCLLASVPEDTLFDAIRAGRSISLCFPEHRVLCSAIVAGHVPIAVGVAWGLRRRSLPRVHCFVGDMAAETGTFYEAQKYAENHDLPITFIVEDNHLSVCTPTRETWGTLTDFSDAPNNIYRYGYDGARWPHSGSGQRTNF